MRRSLAILALLVSLLGIPRPAAAETAWQVVRNVRLYTGPSTLAERITTLHKPERVTGTGAAQHGDYVRVRTTRGEEGWVYVRSVVPVAASTVSPGTTAPAPALGPLAAGEMRAHFIDVGQGLATLLEFSCGAVLIDTGGEKNEDFDSSAQLLAYLTNFFARRSDLQSTLDLLVLSHPHIDHTRGVASVLDHFTVRNAIDNGQTGGSGGPQQGLLEQYTQDNSDIGYEAIHLESIPRATGLTDAIIDPISCSDGDPAIRVLWGQVATDPGWGATKYANPNNHSVVVRVDYGSASFLFPGDLEDSAIDELVQRYTGTALLDVDLYEAGHHGSKNGTTAGFVDAMSPELALIAMGPSTRQRSWTAWKYGHPNKGIVQRIAQGTSGTRLSCSVQVGTSATHFEGMDLSKAIYGTGWDGTIVVSARTNGTISVVGSPTLLAGNP